ncbi:MAG: hypothetical protein ACRENJ_04590 [Candidatus Eiseniibacteriota bacterium]
MEGAPLAQKPLAGRFTSGGEADRIVETLKSALGATPGPDFRPLT